MMIYYIRRVDKCIPNSHSYMYLKFKPLFFIIDYETIEYISISDSFVITTLECNYFIFFVIE